MYNFYDAESDFYQYLTKQGNVSPRTKTNYISWLRFLSNNYLIDEGLSLEKIEIILKKEEIRRQNRQIYKKEKDLRNFYFALKKFLSFLSFDFKNHEQSIVSKEINNVEKNKKLSKTEKETLILSRIGQGNFRKKLIDYWNSCSVSRFGKIDILIASHIKPWKHSDNSERTDVYNGLLLLPNYDRLFDKGYITFDENGKICFSRLISKSDRNLLGLDSSIQLTKIEDKHREYLYFHAENCFMV